MTRRRATAYLLATLGSAVVSLPALPVLCLGAFRQAWAGWHLRLAGEQRWHPVRPARHLRWLLIHIATGLPMGVFALMVVGNVITAVIAMTLWWAFPGEEPITLFVEVPVTDWATAVLLGCVQVVLLTAVVAPRGVGYLLKDRVSRVDEFIDALRRVAGGGNAFDPEVVAQLLTRSSSDPVSTLTPREREVLALMAEGLDNTAIAGRLFITANAVHKHINGIFSKLGLAATDGGHRRVLAVLTYLGRPPEPAPSCL